MKEIQVTTTVKVYEEINEMPLAYQNLMADAKKALKKSYSPYSNFQVGAAALLDNEVVVSGANQENAAYPLCLCAERVVLGGASCEHPQSAVKVMAITVKNPLQKITSPASPCGACRQVLSETEDKFKQPIIILLQGETGPIYELKSAKDLLPLSFDSSYLEM